MYLVVAGGSRWNLCEKHGVGTNVTEIICTLNSGEEGRMDSASDWSCSWIQCLRELISTIFKLLIEIVNTDIQHRIVDRWIMSASVPASPIAIVMVLQISMSQM